MKNLFSFLLVLSVIPKVFAADNFWTFSDGGQEAPIPIQCDGQFNDELGTVNIPTKEELYEQGMIFLNAEKGNTMNAAYCLMAAAVMGHKDAQYKIAQLYSEGQVLPQNDLAAYRWAYSAALMGNEDAQQFTLNLEQFLTTQDIETATKGLSVADFNNNKSYTEKLNETKSEINEKKADLDALYTEIDRIFTENKQQQLKKAGIKEEKATPKETNIQKLGNKKAKSGTKKKNESKKATAKSKKESKKGKEVKKEPQFTPNPKKSPLLDPTSSIFNSSDRFF